MISGALTDTAPPIYVQDWKYSSKKMYSGVLKIPFNSIILFKRYFEGRGGVIPLIEEITRNNFFQNVVWVKFDIKVYPKVALPNSRTSTDAMVEYLYIPRAQRCIVTLIGPSSNIRHRYYISLIRFIPTGVSWYLNWGKRSEAISS